MPNNRALFDELHAAGKIDVRRSALFDTAPSPLPAEFDFDRIEGMLLGVAIGDSLGNPTEGQLPGDRREMYGEIRDYQPNRFAADRRIGLPSDDTQLTFWTLHQLLEDDGLNPDHLSDRLASGRIF